MRAAVLFTLVGILFAVVNLVGPDLVQAADAAQTLAQLSNDLPGPSVEIDFSKGDWWVGLLFYLVMQWMRQRNGPRR